MKKFKKALRKAILRALSKSGSEHKRVKHSRTSKYAINK